MKERTIGFYSVFLIGVYIALELISNATASKLVDVFGIYVPAPVFLFAVTFTWIDLINEHFGKVGARKVIIVALVANAMLALYGVIAVHLPSAPFYTGQPAFSAIFNSTPRIVAASLTAYLIASLFDVEVFAWWRQRFGEGQPWVRVIASNVVSTFVDSALFITIAFLGNAPVWSLILGQYKVKLAITGLSLPLIYARKLSWRPLRFLARES